MCNNNTDCKCISDILKVISILQKKVVCHDECDDTCERKTLGHVCCCACNTRPIQLFMCCNNGDDPLVMSTTKGPITKSTCFSNVFRVEKVDDCCCTCRVLKQEKRHEKEHEKDDKKDYEKEHEKDDYDDCPEFIATNSFFTIDLKCVCAVKCLDDTFVDCL